MSPSLLYRPEIDGLRCLAVVAVIVFHARKSLLPGGYLGVDVFFVISGFLITSIILRETSDRTFTLARFWDRRVKRILPAASIVLLTVSLVQSIILFRPDVDQLTHQKIAALMSFANIYFWINVGDYWGHEAEDSPFLHYWSLSVEEQYYLFFPILLTALLGLGRKHVARLLLASILASLAAFLLGTVFYPVATFYLLPTRIWQLGVGCFLAASTTGFFLVEKSYGTLAGVSLIGFAYMLPNGAYLVSYGNFIVVAGAAIIIWSGRNRVSALLLENWPAVFVGKISYSLYLWHWPVLVTLRRLRTYGSISSEVLLAAIGSVLLIALSLLSFYFVEQPFRKLRYGTPITLAFALVVGGYFLFVEPRFLKTPYANPYDVPSWHGVYYDLKPHGDLGIAFETIVGSVNAPKREVLDTAYKEGGIIRTRSSENPRVVLIGDSHAVTLSRAIDNVTEELGISTSLWSMNGELVSFKDDPNAAGGKFLTSDERSSYDALRGSFIKQWKPDLVIVAARWDSFKEDSIASLFQFLEENAKNVLLVESPPVLNGVGNRSLYQYMSFLKMKPPPTANSNQVWKRYSPESTENTRKKVAEYAFKRTNFSFLPLADLFVADDGVIVGTGRHVFYLEDDHLTDEGAAVAEPRIRNAIENILAGKRNAFPVVSDRVDSSYETLRATSLWRVE